MPIASLRPDLPPEVERLVMRALSRAPRDRHPSMAALKDDVLACLGVVERAATGPTPVPPAARARRRCGRVDGARAGRADRARRDPGRRGRRRRRGGSAPSGSSSRTPSDVDADAGGDRDRPSRAAAGEQRRRRGSDPAAAAAPRRRPPRRRTPSRRRGPNARRAPAADKRPRPRPNTALPARRRRREQLGPRVNAALGAARRIARRRAARAPRRARPRPGTRPWRRSPPRRTRRARPPPRCPSARGSGGSPTPAAAARRDPGRGQAAFDRGDYPEALRRGREAIAAGGALRRPPAGRRRLLPAGALPGCAARVPGGARARSGRTRRSSAAATWPSRRPRSDAAARRLRRRRHACGRTMKRRTAHRPRLRLGRADRAGGGRARAAAGTAAGDGGTGLHGRQLGARTRHADLHLALQQRLSRLLRRPESALPQPRHEPRRQLRQLGMPRFQSLQLYVVPGDAIASDLYYLISAGVDAAHQPAGSGTICKRRWRPGSTPAR